MNKKERKELDAVIEELKSLLEGDGQAGSVVEINSDAEEEIKHIIKNLESISLGLIKE